MNTDMDAIDNKISVDGVDYNCRTMLHVAVLWVNMGEG